MDPENEEGRSYLVMALSEAASLEGAAKGEII